MENRSGVARFVWWQATKEDPWKLPPPATDSGTKRPCNGRSAAFVPSPAIADPGPLGLAAFALTTFVLSMFNAGSSATGGEPVVLGLALAYGGLAQLLAGMWEFRTGNTFGADAFTSYGAFWLSFWAFVQFFAKDIPEADAGHAVGLYLIAWGIFTRTCSSRRCAPPRRSPRLRSCWPSTFFAARHRQRRRAHRASSSSAAASGSRPRSRRGTRRSPAVTNATFGRTVLPVRPLTR